MKKNTKNVYVYHHYYSRNALYWLFGHKLLTTLLKEMGLWSNNNNDMYAFLY